MDSPKTDPSEPRDKTLDERCANQEPGDERQAWRPVRAHNAEDLLYGKSAQELNQPNRQFAPALHLSQVL